MSRAQWSIYRRPTVDSTPHTRAAGRFHAVDTAIPGPYGERAVVDA
jgi:hypothetical protein